MTKRILPFLLLCFIMSGAYHVTRSHAKSYQEDEQLILVGIGAFSDGFYDIAERQFSQFIRSYPTHERLYDVFYLLGKTLLLREKLKEARTCFLKIINESKNVDYMDYAFFWAAQVEMKLGNSEASSKLLLSIVRNFPKFEWLDYSYYLLGILELQGNKPLIAESSFKKVSLLSKKEDLIQLSFFWLGILGTKRNEYETAYAYFQAVWKNPKQVPQEYLRYALFWLGVVQVRLGRFEDAANSYKKFSEQFNNDPLAPEAYWRLGYCQYRLGNLKDAIEIFNSFRARSGDSKLHLYTCYLLGEIFLAEKDPASSIRELNLVINNPQDNSLWGPSFLMFYWNYICLGDMEEGNRLFQRLLKLNRFEEEKIYLQWLTAEILFGSGRISDSLPYYFSIINTRFREKALLQIGRGYFFENRFREALINLDILLLEFPNSKYAEESLFLKGECLSNLGNLTHALETYNLLSKDKRKNPWQLLALSHVGTIHLVKNEYEKAESAFKAAIDIFPNHPLAYYAALQLGNLQFRKEDTLGAAQYYAAILKGNFMELFGEAYFRLGEVFYQQGKYDKALTNFETAVHHLQDNSLYFFLTQLEIGNLQRRAGKYGEAKKAYKTILDHSKDEEIKNAARQLLSRVETD